MHGVALGSTVALLYAPKPGTELRRDLTEQLENLRGQARPAVRKAKAVGEKAKAAASEG